MNFKVFNNSWQCSLLPVDTFACIIKIYDDITVSNNEKMQSSFKKFHMNWIADDMPLKKTWK